MYHVNKNTTKIIKVILGFEEETYVHQSATAPHKGTMLIKLHVCNC